MRLEKIVLHGFKSFADKTEFVFDQPITAIVGPNGCGKSNVVDALKWVLGEQSVKSLRSGQMADVIFGGSSTRKPLSTAEVTLCFSETRGLLPVDADEVQISRRIFRSGESDYRINGKLCRLKDIRELFMDTGVGTRAYSIIEQGQVERLLTSSKMERRTIFEEAAGISKYKAHKNEALRKLDRSDQNLLRLADILAEVQKRLRSVKLAAGKARNYLTYSEKLKELQVSYSLAEYDKYLVTSEDKQRGLDSVNSSFAEVVADIGRLEARLSELGNTIIETENDINQSDNSLVSVQAKIEQEHQRIEFMRSRIEELEERGDAAAKRVEQLGDEHKSLETALVEHRQEQARCSRVIEEIEAKIVEIDKAVEATAGEYASIEADLADEKSGIIDIVRRTAQLHNEVHSISSYRDNLSSQKDRLNTRAENARSELEQVLADKAGYEARLADIEKVLKELEEGLETKQKEAEEAERKRADASQRLAQTKEVRSAVSSEMSVLEDMEKRREGLKAGVKAVLQSRSAERSEFDYVEGIVADIIETDVEYAMAAEAALEGKADVLLASNRARLLADANKIEDMGGRADFVCLDDVEPFNDTLDISSIAGAKGRLIEFVKYESKYSQLVWQLIGKVIVVEGLNHAVEMAKQLDSDYSFVTQSGEYVASDGIIKLGPLGKSAGLISRKSRIRHLEETVERVDGDVGQLETQIARNQQNLEHLEKLRKELRTAIYEANTEKMQMTSKLAGLETDVKRLSNEQPLLTSEIDLLEEQIADSVRKEYDSKQKLEELEAVNAERSARIADLENQIRAAKSAEEHQRATLTDLRIKLGQAKEQEKALSQQVVTLQAQIHTGRKNIEDAQLEMSQCHEQSRNSNEEILKSESLVSELFVHKEENQATSSELHRRVEGLLEEQKEKENLIREKRTQRERIEANLNELKIELSQLEVRQQSLVEKVHDELGMDLLSAYQSYENKEIGWEEVREEMNELRSKIERLGNVNLDAIGEQEELDKRNEFLSSQVADLNESKRQLQQLINRLNKQSRERFQETFEEIRGNFQEVFRKLFGGGKADIILEEAEDILDAGIEIIAKPPGKETRSISLLSGGEKSMTAIALLFAVFKSKPSPFCFLDEVDAALDEANNERFNMIIREFQKTSQFIIITHAKRTMSIADVLYGITMQTRGVSNRISVRFEEYEPEEEPAAA